MPSNWAQFSLDLKDTPMSQYTEFLLKIIVGLGIPMLVIGGKAIIDAIESYNARKQVLEAEKKAFSSLPGTLVTQTKGLWESQEPPELHAKLISDTFEASQDALRIGSLFDLYSKHIEKYQTATQARAGWLFIFTIVAMMAGLAFVVWGGSHVLRYNAASKSLRCRSTLRCSFRNSLSNIAFTAS
jgi:hypothetical protein